MNNQINDGGPAFPNVPSDPQYSNWDTGMTLRDYFAAAALQGMNLNGEFTAKTYATYAYSIADAMLKAREVKP